MVAGYHEQKLINGFQITIRKHPCKTYDETNIFVIGVSEGIIYGNLLLTKGLLMTFVLYFYFFFSEFDFI